jgi:hippurate hydrolase
MQVRRETGVEERSIEAADGGRVTADGQIISPMSPRPRLVSPLTDRLRPLAEQMTAWRRDFHANPELGLQEHRTAERIAAILSESGIDVARDIGGTGVVGTLRAGSSPRSIGFRADMDALPINEANSFAHVSQRPGVMHACGHDGHITMLLGAAVHLATHGRFDGTIRFIFQPAEEGGGGARRMMENGLFQRFPVDSVHSLHNWPDLPLGIMAVHRGAVMAACDAFSITIRGRGGHPARPHHTTDPVLAAGHLITAIQSLVSRETDPFDSTVVSVTRLETGAAANVIPEQVVLHGTIRSVVERTRCRIHDSLRRVAGHGAAAFGASAETVIEEWTPVTLNHPRWVERAAAAAGVAVGTAQVMRDLHPSMTGEDFAVMLGVCPGSYVWLGTGRHDAPHPVAGLHAPTYDFADDALVIGAAYWVALAEQELAVQLAG